MTDEIALGIDRSFKTHELQAAIDHVASKTAGLRKLLVDVTIHLWSDKDFSKLDCDATSKHLLHDLVLELGKYKNCGIPSGLKPWKDAGCAYHEHGKDKQCYKKTFPR